MSSGGGDRTPRGGPRVERGTINSVLHHMARAFGFSSAAIDNDDNNEAPLNNHPQQTPSKNHRDLPYDRRTQETQPTQPTQVQPVPINHSPNYNTPRPRHAPENNYQPGSIRYRDLLIGDKRSREENRHISFVETSSANSTPLTTSTQHCIRGMYSMQLGMSHQQVNTPHVEPNTGPQFYPSSKLGLVRLEQQQGKESHKKSIAKRQAARLAAEQAKKSSSPHAAQSTTTPPTQTREPALPKPANSNAPPADINESTNAAPTPKPSSGGFGGFRKSGPVEDMVTEEFALEPEESTKPAEAPGKFAFAKPPTGNGSAPSTTSNPFAFASSKTTPAASTFSFAKPGPSSSSAASPFSFGKPSS